MMDVSVLGHQVDYPENVTLLDFFNLKVTECSQKIAVRYGRETLTYQELNAKANTLAAQLQACGVGKGDIVPVIIGNSLELPIAWLSLVKLGAVFVPFDPDWPVQRLQTNLAQIGSQTILVNAELDGISDCGSEVINVHAGSLVTSDYQLRLPQIAPDDLIYGFFTSGSTGLPKCALNKHRGIFNRFHYMAKHFDFCQPKTVLLNSRHVFDPSVWQILWTLTVGGEVVIPEKANHLDLAGMIDIIHERSITMTDFVPSIFNALVEMIDSSRSLVEKLSSLQCLLIGGEAINVKT
ncbi:MAG TPA: AMP-binding protein, partial [Pyrinomonadaceae bacterium]